ncbi:hypothetical protein AAIH59_19865 [Pseudomonas aeruginosa]
MLRKEKRLRVNMEIAREKSTVIIRWAVAEAECNTVTGLKQVHHAATPLPLS